MISVGIDISKEKSTVAVVSNYGEVILKPFTVSHSIKDINQFIRVLSSLGEVRIILEATGTYHLPMLIELQKANFFVSVINPYRMKKYASREIRKGKTDNLDAIKIAQYGIDCWINLVEYAPQTEVYQTLRVLGRQYAAYMKQHINAKLTLNNMLDYTMPGVKLKFTSSSALSKKDKLSDFVQEFWHFDLINKLSEEKFIIIYNKWAKKKGYHKSEAKAKEIYELALNGIPSLPSNTTTQTLVLEAARVLQEIDKTLNLIITQMHESAKILPEYDLILSLKGVGKSLSVRLIAEIGDVRLFHSSKALVAFAGIDAQPYQSGNFPATNRRISKRGSSTLRKVGYEIMMSLKKHKPIDDPVYKFIVKKESEGKAKKVAIIAGLNKFLRIYYARVKELSL